MPVLTLVIFTLKLLWRNMNICKCLWHCSNHGPTNNTSWIKTRSIDLCTGKPIRPFMNYLTLEDWPMNVPGRSKNQQGFMKLHTQQDWRSTGDQKFILYNVVSCNFRMCRIISISRECLFFCFLLFTLDITPLCYPQILKSSSLLTQSALFGFSHSIEFYTIYTLYRRYE